MPKHPCYIEITLNPDSKEGLSTIFERCDASILSGVKSEGFGKSLSDRAGGLIKVNFATGYEPPLEWAKKITGESQIFEGCTLSILHDNLYVCCHTLSKASKGEVTSDEIEAEEWAYSKGVNWITMWIEPSLKEGKDPLVRNRRDECEKFCKEHDLLDFWTMDDWAAVIYALMHEYRFDLERLDLEGTILKHYETLDGYGYGW